jgi:hypothetical protein
MTTKPFIVLLGLIFLAACASPTAAPAAETPAEKILPEEIVQEFLTDYQEAPQQLGGYLVPALRDQTPVENYGKLLPLDGMIEGFAVQSVARTGPEAQVTVGIRAGGAEAAILFTLVQQNQNWFISSISKAP